MNHLLLVEDDVNHAILIARSFMSAPDLWRITVAKSIAEARSCLESFQPALALVDYNLPDGKGDVLVQLSLGAFPVVLLTACGDEEMAVGIIKGGALDYVVKTPETLQGMPLRVIRSLDEWARITSHRKAGERLERLNRTLLQLGGDHASNMETLVQLAGELLDGSMACYGRIEDSRVIIAGNWKVPGHFATELLAASIARHTSREGGACEEPAFSSLGANGPDALQEVLRRCGARTFLGHAVKEPSESAGALCVLLSCDHIPTDSDRHVLGLLASAIGVEETRRLSKEALARSEALFRAVWEHSMEGMRIADRRGVTRLVNRAYCEMVSRTREELEGKPLSEAYEAADGAEARASFCNHYEERTIPAVRQVRRCLRDGREVWFEVVSSLLDPNHREPQVLSLFRDVTERHRAQEILRQSEERFRALLQGVPNVAIQGYTPDCRVLYWNRGSELLYDYSSDEAMGRDLVELIIPPPMREDVRNCIAQMASTGVPLAAGELELMRRDGSLVPVLSSHAVVPQRDGPPLLFCVDVDLTSRRKAEQARLEMERQLLHTQKLESLGVLAGGIAHDFNNLLTSMLGNIGLALMDLPDDAPARRSIGEAESAVRRAAELTRQLLAYSGRGMFQVRPHDISRLVEELVQLLKVSMSKSVSLRLHLDPDLPPVMADGAQVNQIVMNLITNASEAIGDQTGEVTITTSRMECDREFLSGSRVAEIPASGKFVCIEVADTGCGMDATVQQRLFDPFYSTKFTGRGLGMSAVLGAVRGHKGAIFVESEKGQGTRIKVLFPVCPLPQLTVKATAPRKEAHWTSPVHGGGLVLVVDDEAQVRAVAERALLRAGFNVLPAGDGVEAVRLHQAHHDEVICAVLDLTMPVMDGVRTYMELRRTSPGLKAILASGYDQAENKQRFDGLGFGDFIQKPYEVSRLVDAVHRLVAAERS